MVKKGFFVFEPLEGVSSEGVMVVPVGGNTKNPFYEMKNNRESSTLTELSSNFSIVIFTEFFFLRWEGIEELQPFVDEEIIGLVEEYIPLDFRISTVSIDGYIYNGEINQ